MDVIHKANYGDEMIVLSIEVWVWRFAMSLKFIIMLFLEEGCNLKISCTLLSILYEKGVKTAI